MNTQFDWASARSPVRDETSPGNSWRAAYEPGLPWLLRRPCGAWFRACQAVICPRQRLLTMASCRISAPSQRSPFTSPS